MTILKKIKTWWRKRKFKFAEWWEHIQKCKCPSTYLESSQEACAKYFAVHILTTWKKQNKKHQNARFIDEKMKTKSLMFFVSIWFARFQILKWDPQSVLRKLLVLSWLYQLVELSSQWPIPKIKKSFCPIVHNIHHDDQCYNFDNMHLFPFSVFLDNIFFLFWPKYLEYYWY